MFTHSLFDRNPSRTAKNADPVANENQLADYGYAKKSVRVFQLKKNGPVHEVTEFKVSSQMRLRSYKEYYDGDNSDIIGSDVQETSIYIHAQKYGLTTPEEFALTLTQHFLDEYVAADASNLIVEDMGWQRLGGDTITESHNSEKKAHNHGFLRNTNVIHYCEVVRKRDDVQPLLISGIKHLRVMKTAKSPFVGYFKGENLSTEGDMPDRILSVEIDAKWQYSKIDVCNLKNHWRLVMNIILDAFLGDSVDGVIITSTQFATYKVERAILDAIPEICAVEVNFLNYPHLPYDFSKFPNIEPKADVFISSPRDNPHSLCYALTQRKENNK